MKHTPGPWNCNGSHIYASDGAIIATINNPGAQQGDYPLIPNRNLMTAAPELLEVAMLTKDSQSWPGNDPDENRWQMLYAKARAAIAKAEGRT